MKKLFTLLMLGATMSVSAQQLANGTFDADWVDCHPWEKGAYLKSARGKQPQGWCMANVNGMGGLGATEVGSEGVGRSGSGKSAVMTNTPNPLSAKQVVPGYMTLGTAWATAQANMLGVVTAGTADGGAFGGISFTSRPDALHFYYKRAHNVENTTKSPTNLTEVASVIAYSWTGTWSQADVPSNTSMTAPTKVTMTDRSNNILGIDCLTGGTITKTDDAELISVIEYYIEGDQSDWKELIIPFEYKNTSKVPEKFNIVFSANDIFADRALMGAGNQLTVDDVELLYWNTLSSLKYDGNELLEGETTSYSVDAEYDAAKLVATAKSQFAEVSTSYDEVTAVATVIVTRENAENKTYTIQFKKPVSELVVPVTLNSKYAYTTICVPFDSPTPYYGTVDAWTVDGIEDNGATLVMTKIGGQLKAHQPVLLENWGLDMSEELCGSPTEGTPKAGLLTGTYEDIKAPKGSYVLQYQNETLGFYKVENTQPTVKAFHAYLNVDSNVKGFGFSTENGATAIKALEALTSGKPEIYDLNGRKLNKLQKGVNIVNGVKVLVK